MTTSARAVYDASADWYLEFVGSELSSATETELDLSMLTAFADLDVSSEMLAAARAGFGIHDTALREPELDHETSSQAFVIARRP